MSLAEFKASNDEQDAIRALTHRLTEWGVEDSATKAKQYIADLTSRGWTMDATHRAIRRPPMKSEECGNHPGEYRAFCRACVADRKAVADEPSGAAETWTPERIRESLHATSRETA